jgi:pimeloyl-ACP methyl ester carboxylesterase
MREEMFGYGDNRCRVVYEQRLGIPILLLHGYSFTSDVWRDIGLMEELDKRRIPYISIDMPYGRVSKCIKHTRSIEENIAFARKAYKAVFDETPPMVVGASLGGYTALKYAMSNPVAGLLLVAPVNVSEVLDYYRKARARIRILYGENDDIVDVEELREFASSTGSELVFYDNAGHALYLDQPARFVRDLLEFYEKLVFKPV